MNEEVKKWNGDFIFVYTPSWSRYFTKNTNKESSIRLKDKIINELRSKKIKVIDLTDFFNKETDVKKYFPLGYVGHYNVKGYDMISQIISENLEN